MMKKTPLLKEQLHFDQASALDHLMALLAIEGTSGKESKIAEEVTQRLCNAGCHPSWIQVDKVHEKIPHDFEMGNLIVQLPGTHSGKRLLFSSHLDTVPVCRGSRPIIQGDKILSSSQTGVGADNRTAVAALVLLAEVLLKKKLPHPPITLLFSVGEEIGLWGARFVSPEDLGFPALGYNIDAGNPSELIVGATGAHRWEVTVAGKSAHAGVHPEHGISAIRIAGLAIEKIHRNGYFGAIHKEDKQGTSNIGYIVGGETTNQVTDRVVLRGESRSHNEAFLEHITSSIKQAFEDAAKEVCNHKGLQGKIAMTIEKDYPAFQLKEDEEVITRGLKIAKEMGLDANTKVVNGGLDANFLTLHGIPTVTLGAGQHHPHTTDEYVDIPEFIQGCELAIRLASTGPFL